MVLLKKLTFQIPEAAYFQIEALEKWIQNKTYLKAIKSTHRALEVDEIQRVSRTFSSELDVEYHPSWMREQIYICPRRIFVHRGNPEACGRQCKQTRGTAEREYEEELTMKVLVIEKETTFNSEICMDDDH